MPTKLKQFSFCSLFVLAHAALTMLLFSFYIDHAMKVDHGLRDSTIWGTASQYLKSIVLLPILLPVLRWHAGFAAGFSGYVLLLLNSTIWAWGCWLLWRQLQRSRDKAD